MDLDFGEKIKQLRIKRNLTQEEVAHRCDLSKGFISQIERDLTSPSIATLMDILECLGTDLKNFFSDGKADKIVFGNDDVFVTENDELKNSICWLIPNAQKNIIEPILMKLAENGESQTYSPHDGEIFGYIISGNITLIIGSEKFKAKKGESFYYRANDPYKIINKGKTEAVIMWISTPPSF